MRTGLRVKITLTLCSLISGALVHAADTISRAFEMPTYQDGEAYVGIPLTSPGDSYRYTLQIHEQRAPSSDHVIRTALIGVHIADWDPRTKEKDQELEWGQILINGEPRVWIKPPHLRAYQYRQYEVQSASDFLRIKDDFEVSTRKDGVPPYIFDVSDLATKRTPITVQITNLNRNGKPDRTAEWGDFIVLRIGYRVWWSVPN